LVTRDELQRVNGGYGLFRGSELVRQPASRLPETDTPADQS